MTSASDTGFSGDDVRVANNESWYDSFSVTLGTDATPPWGAVPAWASGVAYGPGVFVAYAGDLYLAAANRTPAAWTSALTFEADLDVTGLPRWTLFTAAALYGRAPLDLSDVTRLDFAIALVDATGQGLARLPTLAVSTADGDGVLTIASPTGGGIINDIPLARARQVPAGTYAYDYTATFSTGRRARLRHGLWTVDQGIS